VRIGSKVGLISDAAEPLRESECFSGVFVFRGFVPHQGSEEKR